MRSLLLLALSGMLLPAAENTLSSAEKEAGWTLLFDGMTMNGWRDPAKKNQPGNAWTIEDGSLKTRLKPRIAEDLISEESFGDFEFKFDWRVAPGGNTGVKYRIQRVLFLDETKIQKGPGGFEGILGRELANPRSGRPNMAPEASGFEYTIGFEFQLIDDEKHPDAKKDARHTTGALYSMIAPTAKVARPAGEWNSSSLVVKGDEVEHWINGVKVLEGSLSSEEVRAGAAKRWAQVPAILEMLTNPESEGPICLQHHGDEVWFRNLKIRRIAPESRHR